MFRIGFTYVWVRLFPIRPEKTLEDFFLNRFGRELYLTFFKSYTEKVWGVSCKELSAEWGAQRVKGLSITKAIQHALRKIFRIGALSGKSVETSLIEQFLYPTFGPGQMWETVAEQVRRLGGEIRTEHEVVARVDGDTAGGPRFATLNAAQRLEATKRVGLDPEVNVVGLGGVTDELPGLDNDGALAEVGHGRSLLRRLAGVGGNAISPRRLVEGR